MKKPMISKSLTVKLFIIVLLTSSCVKDTYDMSKLSTRAHLSPTLAFSAVKGDVSFSDIVKESDTVVFDENKLVKLIFKEDSVIDLKITDFIPAKSIGYIAGNDSLSQSISLLNEGFDTEKGTQAQMTATIDPQTLDLGIDDILSKITGNILFSNPSIRLIYTNSIENAIQVTFNAYGKRKDKTVNLNLAPFVLKYPVSPATSVSSTFIVDKTNSSLPALISLPPEVINFSGTATMSVKGKSQNDVYLVGNSRIVGSVEVEIPLEFRINNLQFNDTLDNFMKSDNNNSDSPIKPENFGFLRINVNAINGFPLGVTLKMSLYDSAKNIIRSTVDATDLIKPAPVDANGKSTGVTEGNTTIELTKTFFSNINSADKIIFRFSLNTTENGLKDIKIYSDYRIDFKAALVVKPEIQF
jgi:hypothetical protein